MATRFYASRNCQFSASYQPIAFFELRDEWLVRDRKNSHSAVGKRGMNRDEAVWHAEKCQSVHGN